MILQKRVITNEPIVYKKLLNRIKAKFGNNGGIKLDQFQTEIINFRISKANWFEIAKDLQDLGYIKITNGKAGNVVKKTNQRLRIIIK